MGKWEGYVSCVPLEVVDLLILETWAYQQLPWHLVADLGPRESGDRELESQFELISLAEHYFFLLQFKFSKQVHTGRPALERRLTESWLETP